MTDKQKALCLMLGTNLVYIPCMLIAILSFQTNSTPKIIFSWLTFFILPQIVARVLRKKLFGAIGNQLTHCPISHREKIQKLTNKRILFGIGITAFAFTMLTTIAYFYTLKEESLLSPFFLILIILFVSLMSSATLIGATLFAKYIALNYLIARDSQPEH